MKFNNLGIWDIGLTKAAVFFATLFLVSIWDGFANWAMNTNPLWFLVICLLLSVKPMNSFLKK